MYQRVDLNHGGVSNKIKLNKNGGHSVKHDQKFIGSGGSIMNTTVKFQVNVVCGLS